MELSAVSTSTCDQMFPYTRYITPKRVEEMLQWCRAVGNTVSDLISRS